MRDLLIFQISALGLNVGEMSTNTNQLAQVECVITFHGHKMNGKITMKHMTQNNDSEGSLVLPNVSSQVDVNAHAVSATNEIIRVRETLETIFSSCVETGIR